MLPACGYGIGQHMGLTIALPIAEGLLPQSRWYRRNSVAFNRSRRPLSRHEVKLLFLDLICLGAKKTPKTKKHKQNVCGILPGFCRDGVLFVFFLPIGMT